LFFSVVNYTSHLIDRLARIKWLKGKAWIEENTDITDNFYIFDSYIFLQVIFITL